MSIRKYFCNDSYFEKIDSAEKAYYLGLILADGSINDYSFIISLEETDISILESFKNAIEYTGRIYYKYNKQYDKYYPSLIIYSKDFNSHLIDKGIVQNKTYNPSLITEEILPFYKSFLLGWFDGDGSFSTFNRINQKNRKHSASYLEGQFELLIHDFYVDFVKNLIYKQFPDFHLIEFKSKKNKFNTKIGISGNKKVLEFGNWLYKDETLFLKRKYEKFLEFKKYMESRDSIIDNTKSTKYKYISLDTTTLIPKYKVKIATQQRKCAKVLGSFISEKEAVEFSNEMIKKYRPNEKLNEYMEEVS